MLSESVKREAGAIEREAARDRGLGGALSDADERKGRMAMMMHMGSGNAGLIGGLGGFVKGVGVSVSVFDGLTANRRSCVECGYTEAVMHFAFDSWQLAVPRLAVRILSLN